MIAIGKHVFSMRWSPDYWTLNGKRQYIKFTKTVRPGCITHGFIFFNLAVILAMGERK